MNHVSLPKHHIAEKLGLPILGNGIYGAMIDGCGFGTAVSGMQSHTLAKTLFDGYKKHGKELSETNKYFTLIGSYLQQNYGPYHFAKSSTLVAHLNGEYNTLLAKHDVVIMPTLTKTPCKIPRKDASITEKITTALNMIGNTSIFNVTGHPALTLNCGYDNDLPVGLMIVGKHFDEVGVLNVASIFEDVFRKRMSK
ncbi:uncharacterized protein in nthA 5'region-like [Hydractinia symbiolongicarpus]|uniref:uncharacterized protein in nthA 5'region-like n=1 Tax=Hydractinia symbiolongicarpus TaxID=13093 RepID=UPI002550EA5B|nr:uncharacterized protein in nthA 5'region-like [Hydractinia symbiolongicarpus]